MQSSSHFKSTQLYINNAFNNADEGPKLETNSLATAEPLSWTRTARKDKLATSLLPRYTVRDLVCLLTHTHTHPHTHLLPRYADTLALAAVYRQTLTLTHTQSI